MAQPPPSALMDDTQILIEFNQVNQPIHPGTVVFEDILYDLQEKESDHMRMGEPCISSTHDMFYGEAILNEDFAAPQNLASYGFEVHDIEDAPINGTATNTATRQNPSLDHGVHVHTNFGDSMQLLDLFSTAKTGMLGHAELMRVFEYVRTCKNTIFPERPLQRAERKRMAYYYTCKLTSEITRCHTRDVAFRWEIIS
jgi:hypothetical protein